MTEGERYEREVSRVQWSEQINLRVGVMLRHDTHLLESQSCIR